MSARSNLRLTVLRDAVEQRAVFFAKENLARDRLQLLPVVPVADAALHIAQRLYQRGIGLRVELQGVAQQLDLQPELMQVARVKRLPIAELADHVHGGAMNDFLVLVCIGA